DHKSGADLSSPAHDSENRRGWECPEFETSGSASRRRVQTLAEPAEQLADHVLGPTDRLAQTRVLRAHALVVLAHALVLATGGEHLLLQRRVRLDPLLHHERRIHAEVVPVSRRTPSIGASTLGRSASGGCAALAVTSVDDDFDADIVAQALADAREDVRAIA